jgi:hypothetical protein
VAKAIIKNDPDRFRDKNWKLMAKIIAIEDYRNMQCLPAIKTTPFINNASVDESTNPT